MELRNIVHRLNNSISGGAILIAFFSVVSKLLGFYRDRLLAGSFGASRITDIYFASFRIPDLIFNILVLGALTSSFIPIFQRACRKDPQDGIRLSNSVLNLLLIVVGMMAVVLFIATPLITPFLVPGFDKYDVNVTIVMTRIVLISLIFFTASNVFSGVLNAWNKFFTFALSSVVYNLGIIIGIIYFYPAAGIFGLAYGVVLGSMLHCTVQLFEALRNGWVYKKIIVIDESLKKIFILMIPRTIGLAGAQISIVITTILASTLADGRLAIFNYASNLQSFPVGIFGISLAIAAFPSFSQTVAENNMEGFKKLFSLQSRRILFFLIPISFTTLLLRAQIVRVVLGTGMFDWEATRLTAQALGFFSLSLCAQGLIPLLARSFYALEDTKTPMIISSIDIGLTLIFSLLLIRPFGILGLVFADSIAAIANMIVLFAVLHHRVHGLNDTELLTSIFHILIVSVVASALMYLSLQITAHVIDTRTFLGIFAQGFVSGVIGLSTYVLLSILLGFEEVRLVKRFLLKFLRPVFDAIK